MEDLKAFKEARTIKQEMENIVSEINDGDRIVEQLVHLPRSNNVTELKTDTPKVGTWIKSLLRSRKRR
jgi:hypothetical protein